MKFLPYAEAKGYVKRLKLSTINEWMAWKKNRPKNIPAQPDIRYRNQGWENWGEFLGNKERFMSFVNAKVFIKSLGIKNYNHWLLWVKENKLPHDFPKYPMYIYKDEWLGWRDFLGSQFLSYSQAKEEIKQFKIKTYRQWLKFKQTDQMLSGVPKSPHIHYKGNGWINWNDFLSKKLKYKLDLINKKWVVDHYEIDNLKIYPELGIVEKISNVTNESIKANISKDGYIYHLSGYSDHRIIFMCHNNLSSIENGFEIDHIDNSPSNNKISNLQLLTRQEHNIKTGLSQYFKNKTNADLEKIILWDEQEKRYFKIKNIEKIFLN